MKAIIKKVANEYKSSLQKIYGKRLAEVILFGSFARGENHDESDLDFAIILKNKEINSIKEMEKVSQISSILSLKYGIMISSFPTTINKKQTSQQGIYREIRKDGIII